MPRPSTRDLAPGSFAFVMATGIIAVGASLHGLTLAATAFAALAGAAYIGLVVATITRLVRHPHRVMDDLRDPTRAFGFFTFVAATGVVAVCLAGEGHALFAAALLAVAAAAWAVLGYAVPWLAILHPWAPRPVLGSAGGSWFVWVVASQSIAVVAATLEPVLPNWTSPLAILAVFSWSVGLVLYVAVAVLVSVRLLHYGVTAQTFDPTYWIAMGALAITVVAGSRIVEMDSIHIVDAVRGVVAGLAVVLWSFASWLVPALVWLGAWRHLRQDIPLRYEPAFWSMVFPLGMYSVAGMYLGRADTLPFVEAVGRAWFWLAAGVWVVVAGAWAAAAVAGRRSAAEAPPA